MSSEVVELLRTMIRNACVNTGLPESGQEHRSVTTLQNYFGVEGVPMTVVLHEGEIIWESVGAGWLDKHMLEGIVNADIAKNQ